MLLSGLLALSVHMDVTDADRLLWISSTSWMVWNAHVACLLLGGTVVMYDGSPTGPQGNADWTFLWRMAAREAVTIFGAGAAFYHGCLKAGITPREFADLSGLRTAASTGSPLSQEGYAWLVSAVKTDLWVNSASGGTDICGAFVGGLPTLPVYAGELQCRHLGASVEAYDESGQPVVGEVGELVCTRPMPSMPLFFWGDKDQQRYLESYFETFRGPHGEPIWRHGDWIQMIPRPQAMGSIIYGRSDATINRQGVRMGTAELYRAVEGFHEVLDSMVVDLEYLGRESYMALFVVLRPDIQLTAELDARLRQAVRAALTPRHVPNEIVAVPEIPKTLTGKKLELPIKKLLLGQPLEKVLKRDAMANPSSLEWFIKFARQRAQSGK
jgi:acetoacetyl-CoA synthetase